jgi:2-polyprenyl-6-methoxyphenol hydroxylase-like FAD-dependent oxidoreductase
MGDTQIFDVAIVGYGPVGAALAILLGQRGHRVVVLERHPAPYPLPRAVHYDHEVARILQACGVAEQCSKITEAAEIYEFQTADGRPLVRFGRRGDGPMGWPQSLMFSQPELEAILFARVEALPDVDVRRGVEVTEVLDEGETVVLHGCSTEDGQSTEPVRARYVVGCDGANSTVRELVGIPIVDRAYYYDWLVVDVVFDEPRVFDPLNVQICDPVRPTTVVSGGPGRRRWEFMVLPGESVDELNEEATAWRLLAPWDARPDNSHLERHAVYRFQARWVEQWRRGRVFVAGDAAHLTPPFAGQGMCAGMRDAVNLAWKLDVVLGGLAVDAVLDAYGAERGPHAEAVIELAIAMGKLICAADRDEVTGRDEMMLATYDGSITEVPPFPALAAGIMWAESPLAGELFPQGQVEHHGVRGRFDDVVAAGWTLVTTVADAPAAVDADLARWFATLGGAVVVVGADEPAVVDLDGTYGEWFANAGVVAVLQRPDFAVFGTAREPEELDALLRALRDALEAPSKSILQVP